MKPEIRPFDATFVGESLVDLYANVSENFLKKYNLEKTGRNVIGAEDFQSLKQEIPSFTYISGGSIANTAFNFSKVGGRIQFLTKIGQDKAGQIFFNEMASEGVKCSAPSKNYKTFELVVLTTPDGERTFVSSGFPDLIKFSKQAMEKLKQSRYVVIEGFMLLSHFDTVLDVMKYAEKYNCKVVLTLSAPFVVEKAAKRFEELFSLGVDLVIGNRDEARMLKRQLGVEELIHLSLNTCWVVTHGSDNVHFETGKWHFRMLFESVTNPVDKNGAGDAFASGFMYHYFIKNGSNASVLDGMELGHQLASEVIMTKGARLTL